MLIGIFEKIFKELNKEKIKYLVVGGVAVNLYGFARFTGDLDLLILLKEKNLDALDAVMKKFRYSERLPVSIKELHDEKKVKKWLREKNLKAFSFMPPKNNPLQIDIIIEESLKFEHFSKRKVFKSISGTRIPVISVYDLLAMKKKADRPKDQEDIVALSYLKDL